MRRRRHKLEVSTFPFLAVLLCAMGSLILMLLVLDRRAKAAARERAERAAERIAAEELRIAEERRQEWEKRRQALHAERLGQERELDVKMAAVEREIASAKANLAAEETRQKSKRDTLLDERRRLAGLEEELRGRSAEGVLADEKTQDSGQEVRRLSAELRTLERTLEELKALRQRQQQTYSVVPYRGRRGDSRAPIYLECAASGLVFHPDKKTIASMRNGGEIKAEVERRIAQQRTTLTAAGRSPDATPYLLMLVRPDGIGTYYQTLQSLRGLELDFGYELIDADWVLEFPAEGESAKPQPWMVVEKQAPAKAGSAPQEPRPKPVAISRGGIAGPWTPQGEQSRGTPGGPGNGPVVVNSGMGHGTPGSTGGVGPRRSVATGDGFSGGGPSGPGDSDKPSSLGEFARGAPAALGSPQPSGRSAGVIFSGPTSQDGASGASGPHFGTLGGNDQRGGDVGNSQPIIGAGGPAGTAGHGRPGEHGGTGTGQPANIHSLDGASGGSRGASPAVAADAMQGGQLQGAKSPSSGAGQNGTSGGQDSPGGLPHSPTPVLTSAPAGARSSGPPAGDAAAQGSSDKALSGAATGRSGTPGSSGGTASQRVPLQGFDDNLAKPKKPTRRPEVRPAILGGDRDYVIFLECRASGVVLHPFGTSFSAESLAPNNGGGPLLQEAVGRLIARRQATVRPGEQPYRPQVRFLVRPEGLLSMHRAYPVLEELHIPLSRQNLDADDEVNLSDY